MPHQERLTQYRKIERERSSKLLVYATSDRQGAEAQIGADCVDIFVDLLDKIGPTEKISLILHTSGGDSSTAWRLINLIKTFCDHLEIIVPSKAMSAGTLMCLGANKIVMTKQAALGPIDPSLNHALGPQLPQGNPSARVPVSVEAVRGYLDAATVDLGINDSQTLGSILIDLSNKVHPLVLGQIFRSRTQIRLLAGKLLQEHVKDSRKAGEIIDFLSADSGSHDYTINRREAIDLGLPVEKPSDGFYKIIKKVFLDLSTEMQRLEPYNPNVMLAGNQAANFRLVRGIIESVGGGCYGFVSEGQLIKTTIPNPAAGGQQIEQISDQRHFEGWRKL